MLFVIWKYVKYNKIKFSFIFYCLNTGRLQGDKRPRNRNKNQMIKILRTQGKNGPRETKQESRRICKANE